MAVAGHALRLNAPVLERLQQCATRLAIMLAVTEAAAAQQVVELDEACLHIITADMAQAELANTGGVDQLAAAGEMEKPCGGGGVCALAGQFRQCADTRIDAGQQAVDQR